MTSLSFNHPDVIHTTCPKRHQYDYITSKGFGWCKQCERHSPATFKAEERLTELRAIGKGGHIDGGT